MINAAHPPLLICHNASIIFLTSLIVNKFLHMDSQLTRQKDFLDIHTPNYYTLNHGNEVLPQFTKTETA